MTTEDEIELIRWHYTTPEPFTLREPRDDRRDIETLLAAYDELKARAAEMRNVIERRDAKLAQAEEKERRAFEAGRASTPGGGKYLESLLRYLTFEDYKKEQG